MPAGEVLGCSPGMRFATSLRCVDDLVEPDERVEVPRGLRL